MLHLNTKFLQHGHNLTHRYYNVFTSQLSKMLQQRLKFDTSLLQLLHNLVQRYCNVTYNVHI